MTYRQWDAYTNQLARVLAARGVFAGDPVALLLANGTPLASLHLAVQKLGAVSVPLSTRYGPRDIAHCLRDCDPRLLVTDATTAGVAEAALDLLPGPVERAHAGPGDPPVGVFDLDGAAAREPDGAVPIGVDGCDLSVLLYTSGTTGRPKGVPRTHAAEHAATLAHLVQSGHGFGDTALGVMPLYHTMGLRTLLACVATGGTWVPQARFDAEESLDLITREGVTTLYLVPTIYWSMAGTGRLGEARTVRRIGSAGAAMTAALSDRLAGTLRPEVFVNHFGSTEIYTFTVERDVVARPGSAGRAGLYSRVRVVSPEQGASPDDLVAPGEEGQVAVSLESPEAFGGYWRRPDADAKAIRDGWYLTGDVAVRDECGDLYYLGRVDDMINSGGENIYPADIEAALSRCDQVADVVVAGLPDERWGQAVTAFVVPPPGTDPAEAVRAVEAYVHDRSGLPALKRPKRIVAVVRVPKSAVGKILRRELSSGRFESLAETAVRSSRAPATPGPGR